MNTIRIAAALRELADALEDQAEAVKERTAIQHEPAASPAADAPAPTIDSVRALLGEKAKAGKTADCVKIMAGRKVADLTAEELAEIAAKVGAL